MTFKIQHPVEYKELQNFDKQSVALKVNTDAASIPYNKLYMMSKWKTNLKIWNI